MTKTQLTKLTVADLKKLARKHDAKITASMKKEELVKAILTAIKKTATTSKTVAKKETKSTANGLLSPLKVKGNGNILEMKNITKTFLGGKIIANDKVSMELGENEVLAIVGENGSGKSTLMNILFGMYKEDSGEIFFKGEKVDMYASGAAAKYKIGMVHQHFHLVDKFTVLDNILIGQEKVEPEPQEKEDALKAREATKATYENTISKLSKEEKDLYKGILKLSDKLVKLDRKQHLLESKLYETSDDMDEYSGLAKEIKVVRAEREDLQSKIDAVNTNANIKRAYTATVKYNEAKDWVSSLKISTFTWIHREAAIKRFYKVANQYGIKLRHDQRIIDLSVGDRQKVEILKVLWTEKSIVVFDEPTATLSVQEIKEFLLMVQQLQEQGVSVVFISHKLAEVKQIANRVVVLTKGKFMGSYINNSKLTIKKIANLMVGSDIELKYPNRQLSKEVYLEVNNLSFTDSVTKKKLLDNVSFEVRRGEVFGLAGIEGNGQAEILEMISGLIKNEGEGSIVLDGTNIIEQPVRERNDYISHSPTDRFKHGIVPGADLAFNSMLSSYNHEKFELKIPFLNWMDKLKFGKNKNVKSNMFVNKAGVNKHTKTIVERMNVEGAFSPNILIKDLSGGNQQKFVVGRELEKEHKLLLAGHPTRGLDIKAIDNIYTNIIQDSKDHGATILFSLELAELIAVCDRIAVFHEGEIMEIMSTKDKKALERLPELMVGKR